MGLGTQPRSLQAGRRLIAARSTTTLLAVLLAASLARGTAASDLIVVEGNHRVDAEAITAHFRLGSEAAPRAAALDAALKALYATGEFEDVRIIQDNDRVIVRVIEAPVIGRLQFEGNRLLKDADLANAVRLKSNASFTKAAVQADAARIVEMYAAGAIRGRGHAEDDSPRRGTRRSRLRNS
jgi:outer membrane protein insertion porin family